MGRKKSEIAVQKVDYEGVFTGVEQLGVKKHNKELDELSLKKGEYDRKYVINLIKMVIGHCERYKFDGHNLGFSLKQSLQRLLVSIEAEEMKSNENAQVMVGCENCGRKEVVKLKEAKGWACDCMKNRKRIGMF